MKAKFVYPVASLLSILLLSCGDGVSSSPEKSSVSIAELTLLDPIERHVMVDESLNLDGHEVSVKYDNGKKENKTLGPGDYTIELDTSLPKASVKASITLFAQKKISLDVSVCAPSEEVEIASGKIEGINNKIKVIRNQAYGIPDDEYFFLKVMDASRRTYVRNPKSHKLLH